jgi:phage shock protein PspC (stress-responsive transcriptional regulator)
MQASQGNLVLRTDTLLGVCQAIGDDFGFNPIFLRIAFAVSLLWNPTAVIVSYLALGVVVLLSRLIFRDPRQRPVQQHTVADGPAAAAPTGDEAEQDVDCVDVGELAEAA